MLCGQNIAKKSMSTSAKILLLDALMVKIELNIRASEERAAIAKEYLEKWKDLKKEIESEQRQGVEVLEDNGGWCMSLSEIMQKRDNEMRERPVIVPAYERDTDYVW